jgi:hypothetical protein
MRILLTGFSLSIRAGHEVETLPPSFSARWKST